ncbi:unnamed protein product, partial [Meganyctiphanes norvegica]
VHVVVLCVWQSKSWATSGEFCIAHGQTTILYTVFGETRVKHDPRMTSHDRYMSLLSQANVASSHHHQREHTHHLVADNTLITMQSTHTQLFSTHHRHRMYVCGRPGHSK